MYIFGIIQLIEGDGMAPHLYADDTQVSGSCRHSNVNMFSSSISDFLRDVQLVGQPLFYLRIYSQLTALSLTR